MHTRHAVNIIDEHVENIIRSYPHQRRYPSLSAEATTTHIRSLRVQPKVCTRPRSSRWRRSIASTSMQTDLRPAEGRHSGNAFTYAEEDGYLGKYAVIGIHEKLCASECTHENA